MDSLEANTLIEKKETLVQAFLKGQAPDFLDRLTTALDEYFYSVFEKSIAARKMVIAGNPFAVIALGGYGRKEQCIHSDIDLLILFDKTVPPDVEGFVQELLYPLWDARFEVGYAVRNIDECIRMSFERFDILTTVLDARFICGASLVYSSFMEKFRQRLAAKHLKPTLNYLLEHGEKRLEDFGDSTYLVAPDLKSGFGGLRDYHYPAVVRQDKIQYQDPAGPWSITDSSPTLSMKAWKSPSIISGISATASTTSPNEKTTPSISSTRPKWPLSWTFTTAGVSPMWSLFLGELHEKMEFLKQIFQITYEDILSSSRLRKNKTAAKPTKTDGLMVHKRRLYFANTVAIMQKPDLLLKIFLESGQSRIPLSIEARRVASEFRHLVDEQMRSDPRSIKVFKRILGLSYWEFNVLNVMLSTGILQQLIPEFAALVNKIQYNHYHLFPVDKHSIRCVQIINSFKDPGTTMVDTLYASVYKEIRNKNVLLVAGLLHDIGKSDPAKEHSKRGARIAGPILDRLGFNTTEKEDIVFLIENHLLLAKTATRRDIFDEETAVFTANSVGKIRLLRMLFLLTVADSKATGPKAWNDWTENLIKDLFLKTMGILKTGELASKKTQRLIDKKKKDVLGFSGKVGGRKRSTGSYPPCPGATFSMCRPETLWITSTCSGTWGNGTISGRSPRKTARTCAPYPSAARTSQGFTPKLPASFSKTTLISLLPRPIPWGIPTFWTSLTSGRPKTASLKKRSGKRLKRTFPAPWKTTITWTGLWKRCRKPCRPPRANVRNPTRSASTTRPPAFSPLWRC